ncbi:NPCBM/NEW2 domain-containing protein [Tsukamurella sp. M9C]|uniref:NPCBM/NEW2 domain-containing protein n=1 Tax=Tsukamurella sp. M9C TaxID=2877520 RepID=UPI001CCDB370|nr:NPCBM/NEW2 domain-containing protein [Tsukamurella sp. M9C]MCA0155762.1 NPCBM/NEW2 domain-containing protein [Tsukamurella sp. M9C]
MRLRTSFTAATCAAAFAIAGCGAQAAPSNEAHPGSHSVEAKTATASSLTATEDVSPTPTGTPLYARLASSSAVGDTGQALTATLAGTTYRSATGVWIGCEGTAATAVYRLGGEFTKLTGVLGLQPHTPRDLRVRVSFIVDGATKLAATLARDDAPQTISIPLDGARSVTVSALATDGECAPAPAPYGAIGAASLT